MPKATAKRKPRKRAPNQSARKRHTVTVRLSREQRDTLHQLADLAGVDFQDACSLILAMGIYAEVRKLRAAGKLK